MLLLKYPDMILQFTVLKFVKIFPQLILLNFFNRSCSSCSKHFHYCSWSGLTMLPFQGSILKIYGSYPTQRLLTFSILLSFITQASPSRRHLAWEAQRKASKTVKRTGTAHALFIIFIYILAYIVCILNVHIWSTLRHELFTHYAPADASCNCYCQRKAKFHWINNSNS